MIVELVLASGSPRRRDLMRAMGLAFRVHVSETDETIGDAEPPAEAVQRLSVAKARAAAVECPQALIIAADTTVVLNHEILGKPADEGEAIAMLRRLCHRAHQVHTGLAVLDAPSQRLHVETVTTVVTMRDYSEDELRQYVATGDPLDKAGAYAIQHDAFDPVARIEGCYTNVVGLPVCRLSAILDRWGVSVPTPPPSACLANAAPCAWPRRPAEQERSG